VAARLLVTRVAFTDHAERLLRLIILTVHNVERCRSQQRRILGELILNKKQISWLGLVFLFGCLTHFELFFFIINLTQLIICRLLSNLLQWISSLELGLLDTVFTAIATTDENLLRHRVKIFLDLVIAL
jgi:pheromone shutdown protein TraB